MIWLWLLGCAPCADTCGALAEDLAPCGWSGSAGADRADFDAWCAAWVEEERLLARDAGEPAADACDRVVEDVDAMTCARRLEGAWVEVSTPR